MVTKNKCIIIRVTEKEKEKLTELSHNCNKSVSNYMLQKSLHEDSELSILPPDKINIINCMNEIYHVVQKFGNQELTENITSLYKNLFKS